MTTDSPPPQRAKGVQSIERALQLLRLVALRHEQGLPLRDLVSLSGLDRTTAYRMASSLVRAGLLSREDNSTVYRLGLEVMGLGLMSLQRPPLIERCTPVMKALARRSGEHVFLVVRAGDHSHCLHLEAGDPPIQGFAETVGSTRLLGLGVPSFTLLARMDDSAIAQHYRRHQAEYQAQRMSAAKLQRWVQQTRAQGYALVQAQGLGGVGLRFALGSCADAALGILAAKARMPKARGAELARWMADELRRFGLWDPGPDSADAAQSPQGAGRND